MGDFFVYHLSLRAQHAAIQVAYNPPAMLARDVYE